MQELEAKADGAYSAKEGGKRNVLTKRSKANILSTTTSNAVVTGLVC